jgi:hypothetical protein
VLTSIVPSRLASLEPFDDPAWLLELKHDGFSALPLPGFTALVWRFEIHVAASRSRE